MDEHQAMSATLALEVFVLRWSRWAVPVRVGVTAMYVVVVVAVIEADLPRRDPGIARLMGAVHLAAVAVQTSAFAGFVVKRLAARARPIVDVSRFVAMVLLAGDIAERAGPWLYGAPWRDWDLARWQWSLVYGVVWYLQHRRRSTWNQAIKTLATASAPGFSRSGRPSRSSFSWFCGVHGCS